MKDYKEWWPLIRRHQQGQHSKTCQTWDDDYKGFICKYSWEPHGKTAHQLAIKQPIK